MTELIAWRIRGDVPTIFRCIHGAGAHLVRGPFACELEHIAEDGEPYGTLDGEIATPLGAGRYQVRGAVVTARNTYRTASDPRFAHQSGFVGQAWEPLLDVLRKARAAHG